MKKTSKTTTFLLMILGTHQYFAQTGNVGINTDTPTNTLHIMSTANPLRMEGLQTGSTSDNLLTVDATGVVKQTPSAGVKGLLVGTYTATGTSQVTIAAGVTSAIPGVTITFTPTVNTTAVITVSSVPVPGSANTAIQGSIDILQNGTKISSQYYSASDGNPSTLPNGLVRLGNYTTTTRQVNLNANTTYTFSVQAKSWFNASVFNIDPFASSFGGAIASDANAMKTIMNISLFTR